MDRLSYLAKFVCLDSVNPFSLHNAPCLQVVIRLQVLKLNCYPVLSIWVRKEYMNCHFEYDCMAMVNTYL